MRQAVLDSAGSRLIRSHSATIFPNLEIINSATLWPLIRSISSRPARAFVFCPVYNTTHGFVCLVCARWLAGCRSTDRS